MSFFNEQDSLEEWYKETDFESLSHEEKLKLANIEKELGNSFLKENNTEKAIFHYTKCLILNPVLVVGYCNRSLAYYKSNNYISGLEDAIKAVNLDPKNTKAIYRRYTGYFYTNRLPEAIIDLETILSIEPENAQVLIQLKNAQAILEFNKEKEMEYLHNLKHEDESYIDTAKPLNQEEENKENIESKLSEISKNLKEDLKSMDIKLYEETMKKIKLLYEKIKSPSFNDQEEKQEFLNQILLELNDMCFYFSMSDENTKFSYEILNMKKICLKEMIMFEKEKRDPDNEKSLVLINALLKLYQMKNEYQNEKINEEIIFLLKERVLIHTKNKNFYFAKEDLELIKNIEKNIDNNNKKIQEEQKAETPKPNIYKNIFQMKENGVDYFKNNKFKEALSLFTQAKNLIEKEFSPEINCKHHLIFELYIKILKNEVLSLYNLNDFQQADEKLDFILTILPEDEKILELKATNYQSIGTCNIKTLGLNFDPLMKAQEILRKLIEKSISEKDKYQKQLLSIQNEILMKDPEYKKTQKYLEEFEKQCQILEKNHEKFFIYLKEQNLEILEKIYRFKPMNQTIFFLLFELICSEKKENIGFKLELLVFLQKCSNTKFDFHLKFLDVNEKNKLKSFLEEAELTSFKNVVAELKELYKIKL